MHRIAYDFRKTKKSQDVMSSIEDEKKAQQHLRRSFRRWDVIIVLMIIFDVCLIAWDWVYLAH